MLYKCLQDYITRYIILKYLKYTRNNIVKEKDLKERHWNTEMTQPEWTDPLCQLKRLGFILFSTLHHLVLCCDGTLAPVLQCLTNCCYYFYHCYYYCKRCSIINEFYTNNKQFNLPSLIDTVAQRNNDVDFVRQKLKSQ